MDISIINCPHNHLNIQIYFKLYLVNDVPYNCAIERTADAGHGSCGASPAPKAHRFPRFAVGVVRRTVHRGR